MTSLLNAVEAAKVIGLPPQQLLIWAYDETGPQNSGTRLRPSYSTEHLQHWLANQAKALARSIG